MKKMKMILTAMTVILATGGVFAQTAADVGSKFNQAAELINGRQFTEAIPALRTVIDEGLKAGPEAAEVVQQAQKLLVTCYYQAGGAAAQGGNFDAAIEAFTQASELGELHGDQATAQRASQMLSRIYQTLAADAFNNKDYPKAIEIFSKGYEANPLDTDLGLNLAMSYAEDGQLDKSIEVYKAIIALEGRNTRYVEPANTAKEKVAYYLLIDAAAAAGEQNNEKVFEDIDTILSIVPGDPAAQMLRIQTYTNMKDFAKVIEYGEAAAEAQDTAILKSDAYFLLGAAYQNIENKAKAIENYRKVTEGNNVASARTEITELNK